MLEGYQNNNPGNIRLSNETFLGEVDGSDSAFKTFSSMEWGYRAIFVILKHYINTDGLNTIAGIISKYAPSSENDTRSYINHVVQLTGIGENEVIDFSNSETMIKLVAAISWHENGRAPDFTQVEEGYSLLGEIQTAKTVGISMVALAFVSAAGYLLYHFLKVK